ncbi:malignant fibrous histiocytoma-amplified sequence 1 [Colletotrichum spaethianum]|uniref:Malignant fibrous histiocytoma-amplified sequence 1 n=1 Tax=Colletotrichum spaethianum TaxID=700344 RepID=A0AA37PFQ0_9PEZI|nr:malignant fibrous histiocytoma-amplified sequence 1 [Colletotrichum spaethianum]GKT51382.1 malignant fibrous histiocytoma-amplified sequence 1 [Colletotrichum spaethianum]
MQNLESLRSGGYRDQGLQKLKLSEPLYEFPGEILDLADTLEHLDLSGTGLSTLPEDFSQLQKLKIAFFSDCRFTVFPKQLAACPELEMVAFRSNGMTTIPEGALPSKLRWLILTNNRIEALPRGIGRCSRLQKCMLAGNSLSTLPDDMSACHKLGLLRLSANNFAGLPPWLFEMPELAFLSVAGNPCCAVSLDEELALLRKVEWHDLEIGSLLGHGASGDIFKASWTLADSVVEQVAVKLFKGEVTSDGTPLDEMAACLAAGSHDNLISTLASIQGHPEKHGLIMQLIPPHYQTLGLPPSLQTCTRDRYGTDNPLFLETALEILRGIAAAACHLHSRKVSHCDLYAHNILVNETGHALLGDFGAATIYEHLDGFDFEKLEVLAFGHLVEDMLGLVNIKEEDGRGQKALRELQKLHTHCSTPVVCERLTFAQAVREIRAVTMHINEADP